MIRMAFLHALRVSELVGLRWQQISLDTATIHITRAKNGTPGIHGLQGDELRFLRALRRANPDADFVFLSERKAPLSIDGAQKLIERLGEAAKLPFPIHAHMLRHAAGYALAGRGVAVAYHRSAGFRLGVARCSAPGASHLQQPLADQPMLR